MFTIDLGSGAALITLLRQDQSNNETVQTKSFGEDENKNHTDEQFILLTDSADTSITNNTNSHACGQTTTEKRILERYLLQLDTIKKISSPETTAKTSRHVCIASETGILCYSSSTRNNN